MKLINFRFILLFIFLGTLPANISFANTIDLGKNRVLRFKGNLENKAWYFPSEGLYKEQPDFVNTISGELDFTYQSSKPFEVKFNPRVSYDPEDENRNRFLIDDFYIDYFKESFEVRAGVQVFSWKTVESISHADFLNQKDLESNFLDAEKIGEPAIRIRSIWSLGKEHILEFYFFPYFTPTSFPVEKNRFAFIDSVTNQPLDINNKKDDFNYDSSQKRTMIQGAIRYQSTFFDDFDFSLFYFYGYNRFPLLNFDTNIQKINHYYPILHKAGLTFQGNYENWLLKGEFVYNRFENEIINQYLNKLTPSYLVYTSGFEYTFYSPIIQNHDLGTIIELIGDSDTSKETQDLEGFRPFRNHIFSGVRYTFNNVSDRAFLIGGIINYKERENMFQIQYDERIYNSVTLHIEYMFLSVNDTSELKTFEKTNKVELKINFNF